MIPIFPQITFVCHHLVMSILYIVYLNYTLLDNRCIVLCCIALVLYHVVLYCVLLYCVVLLIEFGVVEGWVRCMLEFGVVDGQYMCR